MSFEMWVPAGLVNGSPQVVGPANKASNLFFGASRQKFFPTANFWASLGTNFVPRKGPGLNYAECNNYNLVANRANRAIPAKTRLLLSGWQYGTVMNDRKNEPDARWYKIKELPPNLDNSQSIKDSFVLPFKVSAKQSQSFACYLHDYNGIKYRGYHPGEDWAAGVFKVCSVANGRIVEKRMLGITDKNKDEIGDALGNCMIIEHPILWPPNIYVYSHYLHIVPNKGVIEGGWVTKGQEIGMVFKDIRKNIKYKLSPHLHWEMRVLKKKVNPRVKLYPNCLQKDGYYGYYTIRSDIYKDGYVRI